MTSPALDLVCWDFGDTLVDEMFMRIPPRGVPEWSAAYERAMEHRPGFVDDWMVGRAFLNDIVEPLAAELPSMSAAGVSRHLRAVWSQIEWFPEAREWLERLNGVVPQAIVTVNPWEFEGIAVACGLVPLVDAIVTSAELASNSKVEMAHRARQMLGLPTGLATTLLIDNKHANIEQFAAAGGHVIHFVRDRWSHDAARWLDPLVS